MRNRLRIESNSLLMPQIKLLEFLMELKYLKKEPTAGINPAMCWFLAHDPPSLFCPRSRCDLGCWLVRQRREVDCRQRLGQDGTQNLGEQTERDCCVGSRVWLEAGLRWG